MYSNLCCATEKLYICYHTGSLTGEKCERATFVDNIIEKVSFTFGVTAEQVKSEKRDSNINSARQAAMYIIREITNLSQEEVGKVFGRNHSTVNSSLKNVQQKMSTDSKYKNLINDIIKNINN